MPRLAGGKEEALRRIALSRLGASTWKDIVLVDQRQDCARDEVPVIVQSEGNDWLNVHIPLRTVLGRTDSAIVVELEGYADQRRDGIGELLGELLGIVLLRKSIRCAQQS